jgi:uncharacterized protein (DUF58 family)
LRAAGAVALSLVLLWYATTSEVPWLYLLSTWILALVVVAAAYAYWNARGLRLRLSARSIRPGPGSPLEELPEQLLRTAPLPAAIFEGDALELEICIETTGPPRGPASVAGSVGADRLSFATGIVPRSGWHQSAELSRLRRGTLGAASWEIGSGDFVGFFRGRRRCADTEIALVLPRFTSLSRLRDAREVEAGVAAPRAGSGTELFGVREYRPGDSLRRIHWRSSARHGELIVREHEPPGVPALLICLDAAPPTDDIADQIARIAASEAWDCIRDGGRVRLWTPGDEPTQPSHDVWEILEWLARYPQAASGESADTPALRGEDVVAVTAVDEQVLGHAKRAWVVGDATFDVDVPTSRVGTTWPP